ncbi:hypothetical protein BC827DRAFT_407583 [Russula dissimulans]|nr:hypothetical protein BC827DRAFT_407583 [Russula dissimulans]
MPRPSFGVFLLSCPLRYSISSTTVPRVITHLRVSLYVAMTSSSTRLFGPIDGVPSIKSTLSAGIVGLFIQGIETGLIFSQLAVWLSIPERTESLLVIVVAMFVTVVGFLQMGLYFSTCWRIYVESFGQRVMAAWVDKVHVLLTAIIAAPVQSLLIWRCYYILGEKLRLYIIIPLGFLVLGEVALSILVTVGIFLPNIRGGPGLDSTALWSPYLLYLIFPSVLDIALCFILFYYLTQTRRRVYSKQKRQRVARLMIIVWQSAVPPTLCSISIVITYLGTHRFVPRQRQLWYPTLQAITGKLYILSLFANLCVIPASGIDHLP